MRTAERTWTGGRPLRDAFGDLAWRRPGVFHRELDLEAGSERLAGLRWEKWHSSQAIAESADGCWIIARRRAASREIVVRDAPSGVEVAVFRRGWRRAGEAQFASGPPFHWRREGFWRSRFFWAAGDGRPLVSFQTVLGFGRALDMEVDPAARSLAELPVLILLGAYVMTMVSTEHHAH